MVPGTMMERLLPANGAGGAELLFTSAKEGFAKAQIVVISSIDWDWALQRHQLFAMQLAAAGHEVFFVENSGFRNPGPSDLPRLWKKVRNLALPREESPTNKVPAQVQVVSPRLLPPTFRSFRKLNASVLIPQLETSLRGLGLGSNPIVIAYFPTATTLELIRRLAPSLLVYDCASNFRAHPRAPADFRHQEAALLRLSDLVVCDSDYLYEQKKTEHDNVAQIHQGVSEEFFAAKAAGSGFRRFCYYGTWGQDLNPDFISALYGAGFEVTVSGFTKGAAPALPPEVRRLPPARREDLVRRLEGFDAFLLPYRINPFLLGVIPAKIYECLAMGRPILASPLPSLKPLRDLIYIAESPAEWVEIAKNLPQTETSALKEARIALAREHTHGREFKRLTGQMRRAWEGRKVPEIPAEAPPWWAGGHIQAFARGFSWIGFLYGLAKVSTLLTQIVAGRLLGPLHYGQANLVIAIAAFLQILPMLGFPLALSKFLSEEPSEARRRTMISTTLSVFLVWGALCLAALGSFHKPLAARLSVPGDLLGFSILFSFCTAFYVVVSSPLLGLKRFAQRGLAEAVYGLCAPLFLLAFYWHGAHGYHAMILAFCSSLAVGAAYSAWSLRSYLAPAFDRRAFAPVSGYALLGALNLLTAACVLGPGRLILNRHFTIYEVGVFSAYFTSTAQIGLALLYMLTAVLVPLSSSREGQVEAWKTFRRLSLPLGLGAWGLFIATAALALALFGKRYPFSWPWTILFAGAASLILVHGIAAALYSARDFRGLRVSVTGSLAAGLGNILLGLLLIPRWGIAGAGLSLAGAYLLGLICYAVYELAMKKT